MTDLDLCFGSCDKAPLWNNLLINLITIMIVSFWTGRSGQTELTPTVTLVTEFSIGSSQPLKIQIVHYIYQWPLKCLSGSLLKNH